MQIVSVCGFSLILRPIDPVKIKDLSMDPVFCGCVLWAVQGLISQTTLICSML